MLGIHISERAPCNISDTEGTKIKGTSIGRCRKEVREHRYTCCTDKICQLIFILLVFTLVSAHIFSKCLTDQARCAYHPIRKEPVAVLSSRTRLNITPCRMLKAVLCYIVHLIGTTP